MNPYGTLCNKNVPRGTLCEIITYDHIKMFHVEHYEKICTVMIKYCQ